MYIYDGKVSHMHWRMCEWNFTQSINRSFVHKAKEGRHVRITIISCDYLNLSFANEYVGGVTIPTQVIKYNHNFLQADQPIRWQYSNQIKLLIFEILKKSVDVLEKIYSVVTFLPCIYNVYMITLGFFWRKRFVLFFVPDFYCVRTCWPWGSTKTRT
jgi:hypothetical protein